MNNGIKRFTAILLCAVAAFACPSLARKCNFGSPMLYGAVLSLAVVGISSLFWVLDVKTQMKCGKGAKSKSRSNFDWGMHYFRAFAILTILACHYVAWHGYNEIDIVFFNTSTIYFLFISGYLCQYIDKKRRESPVAYYRKKLQNVIVPFIVFSMFFAVMKGVFRFDIEFGKFLLLGRVQGQYWYIPFISSMFVVSPFICRMKDRHLGLLTIISFTLFLIFPVRPGEFTIQWPEVFYFYTYFSGFYFLGFVYCRFKEQVDEYLHKYWYWILILSLGLYAFIHNQSFLGLSAVSRSILVPLQRMSVLCLMLVLLSKVRNKRMWIFDQIAQFSFTLYFIHFALYINFAFVRTSFLGCFAFLPTILAEILMYFLYLVIMLVVSIIVKAALGSRSRMFIGA